MRKRKKEDRLTGINAYKPRKEGEETEWERVLRRRAEGKCKGGHYRETVNSVTDFDREMATFERYTRKGNKRRKLED